MTAEKRAKIGDNPETLLLQPQCGSDDCPPSNFTTCDTHADLGISEGII